MRAPVVARAARCLAVSVATTVLSAVVLVALAVGLGVPAAYANVVAVCCGIPLSYIANRRWVWRRGGRASVRREVVPFWVMNVLALAISTAAVAAAGAWSRAWPAAWRASALEGASLAVYAALWVAQFVVLDRWLFGTRAAATHVERHPEPLAA